MKCAIQIKFIIINYPFLLNRFLLFWAIPTPKVRLFSMLNSILLISGGNGQKSRGGEGSFIIDPLCFIIKKRGRVSFFCH